MFERRVHRAQHGHYMKYPPRYLHLWCPAPTRLQYTGAHAPLSTSFNGVHTMANLSTALSAILNTVTVAAEASTKIVSTTAKSVDALDRYVTTSLAKQEVSSELDLHNYFETVLTEKKLELAHQKTQVEEILSKNNALKKNFDEANNILEPTFNRIKDKYFPKA